MTASHLLNTLYVQTPGSHLSLDGGAVRCYSAQEDAWRRLPLARLEAIVLIGAVNATTDLLLRCATDGIPLYWLSEFGAPRAVALGPVGNGGTVRSAQHAAHADAASRNEIALTLVRGKIANMLAVLRAASHDATGHNKQALQDGIARITTTRDSASSSAQYPEHGRQSILGLEGATTRFYFTGLRHTMHPAADIEVPQRRTRRPATDPINATLSFAYALTRTAVHGAVHAAGLDTAIGFLHGDRDGQPSLVLDLMEELRPLADRLVTTLFNRRQLRPEHFSRAVSGAVELSDTGRRVLFSAWHDDRQKNVYHRSLNREIPYALVPLTQARLMLRFLTGDIPQYMPYRA